MAIIEVNGTAEHEGSAEGNSFQDHGDGAPLLDHIDGEFQVGGESLHWRAAVPSKISYKGLVIFMSGFGAHEQSSYPFVDASAYHGSVTVSYQPARDRGNKKGLIERITDPQGIHVDTVDALANEVKNNSNVMRTVKEASGEPVDLALLRLVAHSMGGLPAARYAEENSENVQAINNLATVGLARFNLMRFLLNFPVGAARASRHELLPTIFSGNIEPNRENIFGFIAHNFVEPVQTLSEAASCLTHEVRSETYKARQNGVKVIHTAFEHDHLVPATAETQEHVDDYHMMLRAGHMAPQRKPYRVAAAVKGQNARMGIAA